MIARPVSIAKKDGFNIDLVMQRVAPHQGLQQRRACSNPPSDELERPRVIAANLGLGTVASAV